MTTATIIVLSIGVILIIVSFLLTGKDEAEEAEEKTTPGLREELTEADKKQLKKMTDNYIREYGKKQVKDSVQSTVDSKIQEAVGKKQPVIDEKVSSIDKKLAEIDARSEAAVKAISDEAAAISSGWEENRREVQGVYEQITEKEKEIKIQLNLIDEYKKGLEKLQEDADSSVTRLSELQQSEAVIGAAAGVVAGISAAAAENEEDLEEEAEAVEEAAEDVAETADDTEEAVEEAVEEDAEEAEDAEVAAEEEVEEAEDAEEAAEEDAEEAETVEEAAEEDAEEAEETEEAAEEVVEEAEVDEDYDDEAETVSEEDEEVSEEDASAGRGVVIPFVPGDVAESAIEDATKETLGHETADEDDDDFDEYDEDFDDDEDDLKAITNLDQILDREGIDLSAEDPTLNILTMYGAGLSIIEISKVLKMGVGEVKYIIDSNTAN